MYAKWILGLKPYDGQSIRVTAMGPMQLEQIRAQIRILESNFTSKEQRIERLRTLLHNPSQDMLEYSDQYSIAFQIMLTCETDIIDIQKNLVGQLYRVLAFQTTLHAGVQQTEPESP